MRVSISEVGVISEAAGPIVTIEVEVVGIPVVAAARASSSANISIAEAKQRAIAAH
jgi:hypothetical protein